MTTRVSFQKVPTLTCIPLVTALTKLSDTANNVWSRTNPRAEGKHPLESFGDDDNAILEKKKIMQRFGLLLLREKEKEKEKERERERKNENRESICVCCFTTTLAVYLYIHTFIHTHTYMAA